MQHLEHSFIYQSFNYCFLLKSVYFKRILSFLINSCFELVVKVIFKSCYVPLQEFAYFFCPLTAIFNHTSFLTQSLNKLKVDCNTNLLYVAVVRIFALTQLPLSEFKSQLPLLDIHGHLSDKRQNLPTYNNCNANAASWTQHRYASTMPAQLYMVALLCFKWEVSLESLQLKYAREKKTETNATRTMRFRVQKYHTRSQTSENMQSNGTSTNAITNFDKNNRSKSQVAPYQ